MSKNVGKNKNILLGVIIVLSVILVVVAVSGIIFFKIQLENKKILNNPNIYNNIFIGDLNVSNMSKEQAQKALENIKLDEIITLSYKDKQYSFNKQDFGVTLDKEKALENVYNIGRIGSEKERIETIKSLEENMQNITITRNINEEIAKKKLEEIAKNINIEPKNATLEKTDKGFNVIDGNNGLKVNFDETYAILYDALQQEGDKTVEIIVEETKPQYTSQELNKIQDKLGTFVTQYTNKGGSDNNRIINMKVASERINGTILYPGEVFSTNKKFGATTKSNGYKPAPTILNGKFVDEYGGGVCQISSTLYNAVLESELDIVERQNHSLKVGYLDYGYDATLAGDYIDFKFKNNTNYPIYIESYLTSNEVVCNIYGYDERPDNREVKFENVLVEVIEPGPKVIKETDELPEGQQKVTVKPLKGYKYKLYKLVYIDGKLQEKVLVNNSYYRPRAEEVLVGTKKVQSVANIDSKPINTTKEKPTETTTKTIETTLETTTELTETTTQIIEEPIIENPTIEDNMQ